MLHRFFKPILLITIAGFLICSLCNSAACAQQPAAPAPDQEAVLAAVEKLASRRFNTRQQAEAKLWAMGPAIEPMLISAATDANLETRERIQMIREKFELGITPKMPAEARNWIITAINSRSDKQRREATAELAKIGYFAAVMKVLNRLDTPRARGDYVSMIMTQTRTSKASVERDDFHFRLLRLGIREPNAQDSNRLIGHVLRSNQVRQRTTEKTWIAKYIQLVAESTVATARRSLIDGIYFDSSVTRGGVSVDLLVQWINMVADEPDRMTRHRYVSKLLSTSALIASYSPSSRTPAFNIDELFNRLSPQGKNALLDTTANVPTALVLLHEKVGDAALLKSAAQTKNDVIRGNLIGRLTAISSWPKEQDAKHDLLSLIDAEPAGPAKNQIVTGYIQGLSRQASNANAPENKVVQAIWDQLMTNDDHAWQLIALLETYSVQQHFGALHKKTTIHKLLRVAKVSTAKDVQTFAYAPISKKHFANELKKHQMAFHFIESLDELPAGMNLGNRFSSLLAASQYTNTFHDADERKRLLHFLRDHTEARTKRYAASGILRNKGLLKQLLEEGQFESVKQTLTASADTTRRGDMLGRFYANEATINFLSAKGKIKDILAIDDKELSPNGRELILRQLVGSDAAVNALLDAKQYDRLLKSIYKVPNEASQQDLLRRLTTRKAYARILAHQGTLAATLLKLSHDKNWMVSRSYVSLIKNLSLKDLQREPNLALSFWDFATQLPRDYDRRECIKALIASDWFLHQMRKSGRFDQMVAEIPSTLSVTEFQSVMSNAVRQPTAVSFFQEGGLNSLMKLSSQLRQSDRLSNYRTLGYSSAIQKWFSQDDQPKRLITELQALDHQYRSEFAVAFFESGILTKQRENKQLVPEMVKFTNKQPDAIKAQLALVLLTQYATSQKTGETDLVNFVIAQLDRKDLDAGFMRKLLSASAVVRKLQSQKKLRSLIDRCLKWPDAKQRAGLVNTMLFNSYFQPAFTDDELKTLVAPMLTDATARSVPPSLLSSQTLISRLVKVGYFDQLRTIVGQKTNSASTDEIRKWIFYTNPLVVQRMQQVDPKAAVLANVIDQTRDASLYGRMSQLVQNQVAMKWLLDGQGIRPIAQSLQRVEPRTRGHLIRVLTTSNNVTKQIQEHGYLDELLRLKSVRESIIADGSFLTLLSSPTINSSEVAKSYFPLLKEAIQNEKSASKRTTLLLLLQRIDMQNALIDNGDGAWLLNTLMKTQSPESDDTAAVRQTERTLGHVNGAYAIAIRIGDFDSADRLLSKFVDDDAGKLRLIRFRMLRQRFDGKESRLTSVFGDSNNELRYKYYLLRSQNLNKEAEAVAANLSDPVLQWTHDLETHQYAHLAKSPVPQTKNLPLATINGDINPIYHKVEELSFRVLTKQLAELYLSREDADAEIKQLADLADSSSDDVHLPRYIADALLSANRPQQALALLDDRTPRRAFYWHWERLDFDQALQVIGWDPAQSNQLYDSILGAGKPQSTDRRRARDFFLQYAVMMKGAGKTADMQAALNTLRQRGPQGLPRKERKEYLISLACRMHELGFVEFGHFTFAEFSTDLRARSRYFLVAYQSDEFQTAWSEALQWWDEFSQRHPNDTSIRRLRRIDAVMSATTPLDQLGPFPKNHKQFFGNSSQLTDLETVPVTHFRYGHYEKAREIVSTKQNLQHSDMVLIGRAYLAEKNYREAAKSFLRSWELRSLDLPRLYLAGECWRKAGDDKQAKQYKQQARLLALTMGNELGLALGLQKEGLLEPAEQIHRDLMKTSAPCHRERIEALRFVARNEKDATHRHALWQEHDLYHLRPTQLHTNLRLWVFQAAQRHATKAESAIENDDFVTAERAWRDMAKVGMGNTRLIVPLLAKLNERGEKPLADKIYQAHDEYLKQCKERYPNSPAVKEHLAILKQTRQQKPLQEPVE